MKDEVGCDLPTKVKCNTCRHLRRLSPDANRWKVEQSTCTVQHTPLGTRPARWPDVWRVCPNYRQEEE